MDELTLLANALMALDDKLAACMKCGMCQSVCPVFGETMMEADVTRGKLTLLEKLAHRLIEDPDAVNEDGHAQRGRIEGRLLRSHRHALLVLYGNHPVPVAQDGGQNALQVPRRHQ